MRDDALAVLELEHELEGRLWADTLDIVEVVAAAKDAQLEEHALGQPLERPTAADSHRAEVVP